MLNNASNSFTGNISINAGVVSIASDNAGSTSYLGAASNEILLDPTTSTGTLRATGTFTLDHRIQFTTANTGAIEVTAGNTLTVNTAFDLNNGASAGATLVKNDNGTLALTAGNSGWTGTLTINAGAVQVASPAALGSASVVINNLMGSALQLTGQWNLYECIDLRRHRIQWWADQRPELWRRTGEPLGQ